MSEHNQIAIIGPGNISKATGLALIQRGLGDIVFWGRDEQKLRGAKLELMSCVDGDHDIDIRVSTSAEIIRRADIVVVTAGKPRTAGMTRADLIRENAPIIKNVGEMVREHAADALVILVTNPLDAMVELMNRTSGLPEHKIIGMAGILDSRRFRGLLAEELGARSHEVSGIVVGQHSDSMVPLFSRATYKGRNILDMVKDGQLSAAKIENVRQSLASIGATILKYNGVSAYFSPGACVTDIAESYLRNKERQFTASVRPCGIYGLNGEISIGVPVTVNAQGAKPFEVPLSPEEWAAFEKSVADQMIQNKALDEFSSGPEIAKAQPEPFEPA